MNISTEASWAPAALYAILVDIQILNSLTNAIDANISGCHCSAEFTINVFKAWYSNDINVDIIVRRM